MMLNLFDDVVLSIVSSYKFSNESHHSLALIKGSHMSLSHGTLGHTLSPWQCHVFQFLFVPHLTNFVTQYRPANEQLEQSRDVKIYQVLIMNIINQEKLIFSLTLHRRADPEKENQNTNWNLHLEKSFKRFEM